MNGAPEHPRPTLPDASRLVDVATVADLLAVSTDFVYSHSAELGAIRLGSGPKARLRFRLEDVERALRTCSASREPLEAREPMAAPVRRRRRAEGLGTGVPLLPIRGRVTT